MSRELPRLVDGADSGGTQGASSEDAFMRSLLRRGEDASLPSAEKMAELATRLGPILASPAFPARAASGWRWLFVVSLAGVVAAGGFGLRAWLDHPATAASSAGPSAAQASPAVIPAAVSVPAAADPRAAEPRSAEAVTVPSTETASLAALKESAAPTVSVDSLPSVNVPPRAVAAPSASASACVGEIELLDRADTALRSGDAKTALAVTREHATRCAAGTFGQERERIAIEALARLDRPDEVRARAKAFEARYPSSPHLRRIRSLAERGIE